MAKAKIDTNNEYLDARAEDFSERVQEALKQERAAYDMLKQAKAVVLAAVIAEMPMPEDREVKRTAYTAWGQWQIVVGDKVVAKAKEGARKTLAEYMAEQAQSGRSQ